MKENTILKERLKTLNADELLCLLIEIANLRKENRTWLRAKLAGMSGIDETIAYYKKKIHAILWNEQIKIKDAKMAMADFKKICSDQKYILKIMVFYVGTCIEVENEYGDLYESFYASVESVFENIIIMLNKNPELIDEFSIRLNSIVEKSAEGWGHQDSLRDVLSTLDTNNAKK